MDTLPKDLVRLLMTTYFDPFTSVRCLLVSRKFFEVVDSDEIRRRAVKHRVWLEDHARTDKLMLCERCNCLLTKKNLERHMDKHAANPDMQYQHGVKVSCEDCDMKFPPKNHSDHCALMATNCMNDNPHRRYWPRSFLCECDKVLMPRARLQEIHHCTIKCLSCNLVEKVPYREVQRAYLAHKNKYHGPSHVADNWVSIALVVGFLGGMLWFRYWPGG